MKQEIVATDYCQETIDLKKTIESGFIVLGERLSKIKTEELWNKQWGSFSEYLMEMNLNESTASKMIAVHQTYVLKYNIDEQLLIEAGWDKLYQSRELLSKAKTKQDVIDMVHRISTLKRDDARELIREHRNPDCQHDWQEIHLRQCKECGKRESIHG